MPYRTDDIRIQELKELLAPVDLIQELPVSAQAARTVHDARRAIHEVLHGKDERLVVIMGPCSVHDPEAALEYAARLKNAADLYCDELLLVMRVYFEKPRTTVGWKGLINDPYLDGSFQINEGLRMARKLLLGISELGLPAGTEFLDVISPQFIADLISWGAIGARTTESQVHRELASGLSCPVGFKNGTDGNVQIAYDALRAARKPHQFLSVTKSGRTAIVSTRGNNDCHVILRGGREPNYQAEQVEATAAELARLNLCSRVMIDCSHANSRKDYRRQPQVAADVAAQVAAGSRHLLGLMVESHLVGGRQDHHAGKPLVYGQSITDSCLGWEESLPLLDELARARRGGARLAVESSLPAPARVELA